jgi:hypothetical protein
MCIAGKSGTKIKLHLEFLEERLHLPIIVLNEFNLSHLIINDQSAVVVCAKQNF